MTYRKHISTGAENAPVYFFILPLDKIGVGRYISATVNYSSN